MPNLFLKQMTLKANEWQKASVFASSDTCVGIVSSKDYQDIIQNLQINRFVFDTLDSIIGDKMERGYLEYLTSCFQLQTFEYKNVIYREGMPADSLYIIKKGQVELYSYFAESKRDLSLSIIGNTSVFGQEQGMDPKSLRICNAKVTSNDTEIYSVEMKWMQLNQFEELAEILQQQSLKTKEWLFSRKDVIGQSPINKNNHHHRQSCLNQDLQNQIKQQQNNFLEEQCISPLKRLQFEQEQKQILERQSLSDKEQKQILESKSLSDNFCDAVSAMNSESHYCRKSISPLKLSRSPTKLINQFSQDIFPNEIQLIKSSLSPIKRKSHLQLEISPNLSKSFNPSVHSNDQKSVSNFKLNLLPTHKITSSTSFLHSEYDCKLRRENSIINQNSPKQDKDFGLPQMKSISTKNYDPTNNLRDRKNQSFINQDQTEGFNFIKISKSPQTERSHKIFKSNLYFGNKSIKEANMQQDLKNNKSLQTDFNNEVKDSDAKKLFYNFINSNKKVLISKIIKKKSFSNVKLMNDQNNNNNNNNNNSNNNSNNNKINNNGSNYLNTSSSISSSNDNNSTHSNIYFPDKTESQQNQKSKKTQLMELIQKIKHSQRNQEEEIVPITITSFQLLKENVKYLSKNKLFKQ